MVITHGKTKQELMYMRDLFKKLFENKVDDVLETRIHGKLSLYVIYCDDQDLLEDFVKEYFKMRKKIVDIRNNTADYIKSEKYQQIGLISKIKTQIKFNKECNLCENINKFEKEFFQRTNISLLRVENERLAKEQLAKKEQSVQQ